MERLELLKRQGKTIEIIEKFDPKKDYKIPIRKQVFTVLSELEKGKQYRLVELVEKYDGVITKKKNLQSTRQVFKHMMNIGKEIGVIKEITDYAISFENFCELDTVSYLRRQLKETKFNLSENKESRPLLAYFRNEGFLNNRNGFISTKKLISIAKFIADCHNQQKSPLGNNSQENPEKTYRCKNCFSEFKTNESLKKVQNQHEESNPNHILEEII